MRSSTPFILGPLFVAICGCADPAASNPKTVEESRKSIINGDRSGANPPGMVAFIGVGATFPTSQDDYYVTCGGTHIAAGTVLTAAHCFTTYLGSSAGDFSNVMADVMAQADRNQHGMPAVKLRRVARHPEFMKPGVNTRHGDVAVVRLESDPHPAGPFATPATPDFMNTLAIPSDATVHGWGVTQAGSEYSIYASVTLNYLGEGSACHGYPTLSNLTDAQLCLGRKTDLAQGPCEGDSGGPAFVMDGTNFVQIGIVSGGGGSIETCGDETPDIYTSVARVTDFITRATDGVTADVTGDGAPDKIFIWEGPSTLLVDVEKNDGTLLARLDTQIPAAALRSAQANYLDALEIGQFVGDATNDIRVSFDNMVAVFEGGRTSGPSPSRSQEAQSPGSWQANAQLQPRARRPAPGSKRRCRMPWRAQRCTRRSRWSWVTA